MKGKIAFVLVAALLIFTLGTKLGLSQEKATAMPDSAQIMSKLNEILANQAEILKQFGEVKRELAIIKIRTTR